MWRVWAPTSQQTCTTVPQSALLMPPGHLLARVLVGGRRRAAVALRRAALQAQRQASGGTDAFRGRWTWRLLLRCEHREVTSLCSRGVAKPEVAYCANGSVGAHAKKQGAQEPQPRLGTRRQYPAVEPAQLERAIDAPSLGRRCVWPGGCTGPSRRASPVHCASGALTASIAGVQSPAGPRRLATPHWPKAACVG